MYKYHQHWIQPGNTMKTAISKVISTALLILAAFNINAPVVSAAEGQPIVRSGKHCPSGYRKSGEYCVPRSGSTSAPAAIEKNRTCPSGYRKSGEYCVARAGSQEAPHIIEEKGACPAGYRKSGKYCVERGK